MTDSIENKRAASPPPDGDAPLILVAEDDRTLRFLYRRALEGAGFRVIEAENGAAALETFKDRRPAITVLDVLMPIMDGFSACAAIRALEAGHDAPVLVATSLDDLSSIERAYDVGATDFISKPINWQILIQRIRYMLRADETFRRLQESERRLAQAQRIASLGNFVWRIGASAIETSDELRHIFGIVREGGSFPLRAILRQIPAAERVNLLKAVRSALENGTTLQHDLSITPQGESRKSIDIRGEIVVDGTGRTTVQGTVQDISERKRTEMALATARRTAESADAVKSALLAGMNHELRTPLNAIIGFSEIISGEILGPLSDKRYKEFATDILQSGRHMLDLVTSILDMAKLASDHHDLNLEPADLRVVVNDAIDLVSNLPAARGRTIIRADWNFPTFAKVDLRAVKQMLIHLLSNALKFSAPETSVRVAYEQKETGELWLSIIDQGIGMTPEEIELAIQPFCQIDNRLERKFEGLGIGLSIVNKLIDCHGGRLVIESSPGEGSKVSLVFPKNAVFAPPDLSPTTAQTQPAE